MRIKQVILIALISALTVSCKISSDQNDQTKPSMQIVKETAVNKDQLKLPNFIGLVKQVGNTVVNITADSSQPVNMFGQNMNDPFYEFFKRFAPQAPEQQQLRRSMGSGFIISTDGYILTNAHVVNGAKKITVKINDKREFVAQLIGIDQKTDIALLKVNATNLPAVKIGDSNNLEVGEWVAAIGAPFGFDNSVTQGIVSAKGRNLPNESLVPFIQTDVPINPGNSGGPLFNLNGEVVGMNSQIYSRSGGYMGISFSIPIDVVMNIAQQLKQFGKATHGQLGVQIQPVTQDLAKSFGLDSATGALVAQVIPGSAADKAGIKAGDVILKADNTVINDAGQLPLLIGNHKPGDIIKLTVFRNDKTITIKVVLAAAPQTNANDNDNNNNDQNKARSGNLTLNKFGLTIANIDPDTAKQLGVKSGVVITQSGGVAQMAGIAAGDVILSVNNQRVSNTEQIKKAIGDKKSIALLISRNGQQMFVTIAVE